MDQTDRVSAYHRAHERIVDLVERADDNGTPVGACPGWRVRDVVAHVTGIAVDFQEGRLPGGDVSGWTSRQVAERAEFPVDTVVREWRARLAGFEQALQGPLAGAATSLTADIISHYYDISGALDAPADRGDPDVLVALDAFATMLHRRVTAAALAPLEISVGVRSWIAGRPDGGLAAVLRATPFEALRALSGRRTPDEIVALDWDGDSDSYLAVVSAFPFPAASLGE